MKTKGFTLIELLIVVAIIGILAAIAIPNFLQAQTRAKVAKVEADFRTIALALESYCVDNQYYPPSWSGGSGGRGGTSTVYTPLNWDARLIPLTTPIPYISSIPDEPFTQKLAEGYLFRWYCYDCRESRLAAVGSWSSFPWMDTFPGPLPYEWLMFSAGPARVHDWTKVYDPTNGTISEGSIFRFGP